MNMLRHVLGVFGMTSDGRPARGLRDRRAFDGADLVIVGPGPGDPRDGDDPKIATFRRAVDDAARPPGSRSSPCAWATRRCASALGIPLAYKDIVFQGTQSPVPLGGRTERVGFYNTFVGRVARRRALPDGVTRRAPTRPPATSTRSTGPHYRGIQFHAESILTENGYDLIHELVAQVLRD